MSEKQTCFRATKKKVTLSQGCQDAVCELRYKKDWRHSHRGRCFCRGTWVPAPVVPSPMSLCLSPRSTPYPATWPHHALLLAFIYSWSYTEDTVHTVPLQLYNPSSAYFSFLPSCHFHSYAGLIVFLENFKLAPQGFALAVDSAHITLSQFFKKLIPFIVQVSAQLLLLQSPFLISLLKLYLRSITTTLTS